MDDKHSMKVGEPGYPVVKRLKFGGMPLTTFEAATDETIDLMWSEIKRIDETLATNDTTKAKIRNKAELNTFLDTHCKCRY